jgi:hypothetical protein
MSMHCAYCSEKIVGRPISQGNDAFCSLECANLASGIDPDEYEEYFVEDDIMEELYEIDE